MADSFTVTGFDRAAQMIRALIGPAGDLPPGPVTLPPALAKRVAVVMTADIKTRFQTGTTPEGTAWPPLRWARVQGGSKPLMNTGLLRSSIWGRAETDGATAGTNDQRAPLMNFGGTVTPKRAKFLALPLTREASMFPRPREFPRKLAVIRTKKGGLILAETKPPGKQKKRTPGEKALATSFAAAGNLVPQYALLKSVTVPARKFIGISPAGREKCSAIVAAWATGDDVTGPVQGGAA